MPKSKVNCSQCGAVQFRWLVNPNTNLPIKNFFCDNTCKGTWQIAQREALGFTCEWLEHEYLALGKGANQIGKEIGRDGKRVWEWLIDYGVPTRTRGHDTSQLPKSGETWAGRKHSASTKAKMSDAAKADGRLPWGKDNPPYWRGRGGSQHPCFKGGLTPERQTAYASSDWTSAVKTVWARDNAACQVCGKHHNSERNRGNFHIHHVVSFQVRELRTDPSNLVLLCKECHKFVHSKANTSKQFIKEPQSAN